MAAGRNAALIGNGRVSRRSQLLFTNQIILFSGKSESVYDPFTSHLTDLREYRMIQRSNLAVTRISSSVSR